MRRLRVIFFGAGAFGLPTLDALVRSHDVPLVVSQPDRPAGRGRTLTPTPIAARAIELGLNVRRPADVNAPEEIAAIHAVPADAFVVIAFGQKLSPALLRRDGQPIFAINLHASLLPAYRGAAPINWAMIDGCAETGVSVISLAERMDAGVVYARRSLAIDPLEIAGELHDRLAALGPEAILSTLERRAAGEATCETQDESKASRARKLSKDDGRIDLAALTAFEARCRIHGLSPWPGCDVAIDGAPVRLLRVRDRAERRPDDRPPGTVNDDGTIACRSGRLEILELQPPGGRPMTLAEYRNGRRYTGGLVVTRVAGGVNP